MMKKYIEIQVYINDTLKMISHLGSYDEEDEYESNIDILESHLG